MLLISHRGNLNGIQENRENNPTYINEALNKGYDVEVDVRYENNKFFLGHDTNQYEINKKFLENKKLWCHAKSMDTMGAFYKTKCHYFWHETDAVTLTNKGYYWTYPGNKLFENSICVLPEKSDYKSFFCKGICSDYILKYKNND